MYLPNNREANIKLYFADGGSTFQDYSRVGYDSRSLICRTKPFPAGTYSVCCEVSDLFTEAEAQYLGDRATSYVVNDGYSIEHAVRHVEAMMLSKKRT